MLYFQWQDRSKWNLKTHCLLQSECLKTLQYHWRMVYLCFTFFCKARCVSIWRIGHCYVDIIGFDLYFTKVKCYLNIDSFSHASQNFIHFSCMEKYSKHKFKRHVVLNHPHIQHLQDLELCQTRKQNRL